MKQLFVVVTLSPDSRLKQRYVLQKSFITRHVSRAFSFFNLPTGIFHFFSINAFSRTKEEVLRMAADATPPSLQGIISTTKTDLVRNEVSAKVKINYFN